MNESIERIEPTRDGRWGVRWTYKGRYAGGTGGCGWETREQAVEQSPPYESSMGLHVPEVFPRWDDDDPTPPPSARNADATPSPPTPVPKEE